LDQKLEIRKKSVAFKRNPHFIKIICDGVTKSRATNEHVTDMQMSLSYWLSYFHLFRFCTGRVRLKLDTKNEYKFLTGTVGTVTRKGGCSKIVYEKISGTVLYAYIERIEATASSFKDIDTRFYTSHGIIGSWMNAVQPNWKFGATVVYVHFFGRHLPTNKASEAVPSCF